MMQKTQILANLAKLKKMSRRHDRELINSGAEWIVQVPSSDILDILDLPDCGAKFETDISKFKGENEITQVFQVEFLKTFIDLAKGAKEMKITLRQSTNSITGKMGPMPTRFVIPTHVGEMVIECAPLIELDELDEVDT
jgi:hypothetical protein